MCVIYHLLVWSNLNFLHISQWITFPTQSYLVLYSFYAIIIISSSSSSNPTVVGSIWVIGARTHIYDKYDILLDLYFRTRLLIFSEKKY